MERQERLAEWLVRGCEERNWSWNEACRKAGLAENAISKIVNGQGRAGLKSCYGFARAFGVPLATMLELAGIEKPRARGSTVPELMSLIDVVAEQPQELQHIVARPWASTLDAVLRAAGKPVLRSMPPAPQIQAEVSDTIRIAKFARKFLGIAAFTDFINGLAAEMGSEGFTVAEIEAMKQLALEE